MIFKSIHRRLVALFAYAGAVVLTGLMNSAIYAQVKDVQDDDIQNKGIQDRYVIGVELFEYRPLHWIEDGDYRGFNRELLDAFATSKKYHFSYHALPVKTLYIAYVKGELDFNYPDDPNWSSDLKEKVNIEYSKGVLGYIEGAMVPVHQKNKSIDRINTLGTIDGFTPWAFWSKIQEKEIDVIGFSNFESLLKVTMHERIDAAYISVDVANFHLTNILQRPGSLVFDPKLPHVEDEYHLSTIKHKKVIQEFDEFLYRERKLINALKKKYQLTR